MVAAGFSLRGVYTRTRAKARGYLEKKCDNNWIEPFRYTKERMMMFVSSTIIGYFLSASFRRRL